MTRVYSVFLTILFVFLTTVTANATTISVYDDIIDNTYMSSGTTLSGLFDINPEVPTNGDYVIPYDVDSASYTFQFTDDGDLNYDHTYIRCSSYSGYNYTVYNKYYYNYYIDEYEQVAVNMSGEVSSDGTDWYNITLYDGGSSSTYVYGSWPNYHYVYYHYYYYDVEQGYTGIVTIQNPLGSAALDSLSDDGIINFSLTASTGDIIYNWGMLNAEITPNSFSVPDASIVLFLGSSLMGLAVFSRKSKKS